jgi:hypothetical protein
MTLLMRQFFVRRFPAISLSALGFFRPSSPVQVVNLRGLVKQRARKSGNDHRDIALPHLRVRETWKCLAWNVSR